LPFEELSPAGDADSVDVLPDLDFMSGAFGSSAESSEPTVESSGGGAPLGGESSAKSGSDKKGPADDFKAQEMASAIQTILKREDKG
jgi:hypothetical protein